MTPRPRGAIPRDGRARAVEGAVQMDGEHPPPLVVAEAHERIEGRRHRPVGRLGPLALEQGGDAAQVLGADRARVVDEDVHRSELRLDPGEGGVHGRAVAHVADERDAVPAGHPQRLLGALRAYVEHRDARAVPSQPKADGASDARCTAGHDGHGAPRIRLARVLDHGPAPLDLRSSHSYDD